MLALANVPPSCLCDWRLLVQWPRGVLFALAAVVIMIDVGFPGDSRQFHAITICSTMF